MSSIEIFAADSYESLETQNDCFEVTSKENGLMSFHDKNKSWCSKVRTLSGVSDSSWPTAFLTINLARVLTGMEG